MKNRRDMLKQITGERHGMLLGKEEEKEGKHQRTANIPCLAVLVEQTG